MAELALVWTIRSTIAQYVAALATIGACVAAWHAATVASKNLKESIRYREVLIRPILTVERESPPTGGCRGIDGKVQSQQFHFRFRNAGYGPAVFEHRALFEYNSEFYGVNELNAQDETEIQDHIFAMPDCQHRLPTVLVPKDEVPVQIALGNFGSVPMDDPFCFNIVFYDITRKQYRIFIKLNSETGEVISQENIEKAN